MKTCFGLPLMVAMLLFAAGCTQGSDPEPPAIPFAKSTDESLKDPDNPIRTFHIDFARVEREVPLSRADLAKITPQNIANLPQEQADQIYGRLTAGPIPDGPYQGDLFFARGDSGESRLGEVFGGVAGRIATAKIATLEAVGRQLWKGKMFYRNELVLRNLIDNLEPFHTAVLTRAA